MAIDLTDGKAALARLLSDLHAEPIDFNEADTRHRILDRIIHECLGWDRAHTSVERRVNDEYSDYELGAPAKVLVEAKRSGLYFDIPIEPKENVFYSTVLINWNKISRGCGKLFHRIRQINKRYFKI